MKGRLLIATALLACALPARAATIGVDVVRMDDGWFRADVTLDPEGDDLNAVSGTLTFDASLLELKRLEDRSTVTLWVERPALARTGEVDFAGTVPGGFGAEPVTLFSAAFQETGTGAARIGFRDALALKDDGAATPASLRIVPSELSVQGHRPGDPAPALADDVPPEPFDPQVARDPSLFDGVWFLSFAAQDKESGIAGYDVAESLTFVEPNRLGSERWRAAESPYRLQDQSLESWIYVRAVDRSGNVRIETRPPSARPAYQGAWRWGILGVLALCAFAALRLIRKARRA
jgi:hypothetical protein